MEKINICWLRRDLRLDDNAALYHALNADKPVLLLFILDKKILDKLRRNDARVTFIYLQLQEIRQQAHKHGSSILVKYGNPAAIWEEILKDYAVADVYTNIDYEPSATTRDKMVKDLLRGHNIGFHTFKDQVIFDRDEVVKADGTPYTVFTPYYKIWLQKLDDFYVKAYPSARKLNRLLQTRQLELPSLKSIGFSLSEAKYPSGNFAVQLDDYERLRDYPAEDATTHLGMHLRFGTVSIRHAAKTALKHKAHKWLSELAWRDFYMMILWHFPHTARSAFKPAYDNIKWHNDEKAFEAWCKGKTGYPIVDAGMRQLNATGFMHNRVRMVVASFLTKHLLTDWRWGAAYFAEKLLDYDLASNIGGWQWAAGSGNDAAPYFRIFNPEAQAKKFDPKLAYIKKWVPEYGTSEYIKPIIEHTFARARALKVYKAALSEAH